MDEQQRLEELERAARSYQSRAISVRDAHAKIDERRSGEPVTRLTLLLSAPARGSTWRLSRRGALEGALEGALHRDAAAAGLPPLGVTLISENEHEAAEVFKPAA